MMKMLAHSIIIISVIFLFRSGIAHAEWAVPLIPAPSAEDAFSMVGEADKTAKTVYFLAQAVALVTSVKVFLSAGSQLNTGNWKEGFVTLVAAMLIAASPYLAMSFLY